MRGLLSTRDIRTANTPLGLLGVALPPVNRAPVPAAAPAASATPRRERVSPWRIFDRVLGGQTVTEGQDAERARLDAEAMRPQQMEQMARLRGLAEQMGPAALLAFETNPEKFGENLAQQYAPQVIAAGGVQSVIGNGQRVAAPSFAEFGQDMVRRDPITGAVETVASRGPTFSEQTARINANNPVNVAPGGVLVDPRSGAEIARGAPRLQALSDGAELYDEAGRPVARNAPEAPPPDPRAAERNEARQRALESERQQIASVRDTIQRARGQISAWTTGPLAGLSAIGGTPAADLAATLDTIEANLSFRALAEMRANSPTGGALGSITERELQLLGATVANLRQSQSPAQLRDNLAIIERTLTDIERRSQQQAQQSGGASREALLAEARRRGLIR